MEKVIRKARFYLEELTTIRTEVEAAINSRPLTFIDGNPNNNTLRPKHLSCGRNIQEKCFEHESKNFRENDARSSLKLSAEIICKFFQRKLITNLFSLQDRYFYNKTRLENKCRAHIGNIVLIKEGKVPRMNWRKGKINNLIFGNHGLV